MGHAEYAVCEAHPENLDPGLEQVSSNFKVALPIHITLDRKHSEDIPAAVDSEVKAVTSKNMRDDDTII